MTEQKVKKQNVRFIDGALVLLFAILANLAAQGLFSFAVKAAEIATERTDLLSNVYIQLLGMFMIQIFYVSVPFLYFKFFCRAVPQLRYSIKNRMSILGIVLLLIVPIISICCFYLPAAYFDQLLTIIGFKGGTGVALITAPQIILGLLLMVVLAPLLEEYIFRGFLLSGLRGKYGETAAILLSALAFSLMHMNPQQTVYQFLLGAVCGYFTVCSGSVAMGIGIHAGSNLIALLFDLTPLGTAFSFVINAITSTWYFALLSTVVLIAVGVIGMYFLGKALKRGRAVTVHIEKLPLAPQFSATPSNLGVKAPTESPESIDHRAKRLFFTAIGVCALMWIIIFFAGIFFM